MKTGFIAIALAGMLGGGVAVADITDGNDLLESCHIIDRAMEQNATLSSAEFVKGGQCLGLIEGVRNTILYLNNIVPKNYKVCFPEGGIKNNQAIKIVEKYLREHPEDLNQDQTFLTMMAYKTAYPCK